VAVQRCKFCRCTERQACRLVAVKLPFLPAEPALIREFYILGPAKFPIVPAGAETHLVPCGWLLEDVCSNPRCVERAYLEARELAEELDALDEQELEAALFSSPFSILNSDPIEVFT
jgi:hypothetical protein